MLGKVTGSHLRKKKVYNSIDEQLSDWFAQYEGRL